MATKPHKCIILKVTVMNHRLSFIARKREIMDVEKQNYNLWVRVALKNNIKKRTFIDK